MSNKEHKYVFPPLQQDSNYELWRAKVLSSQHVSQKWEKYVTKEADEQKKAEYEANNLFIAAVDHPAVGRLLLELHQAYNATKVEGEAATSKAQKWLKDTWDVLNSLLPVEKDTRFEAEKQVEAFPERARKEYGDNIGAILPPFKLLCTLANKHKSYISTVKLADALLRSLPYNFARMIAMNLGEGQGDVDRVLTEVDQWVRLNGSELWGGTSRGPRPLAPPQQATKGGTYFTGSQERPHTQGPVSGGNKPSRPKFETCRRCGARTWHPLRQCPARESTCDKCNGRGHFTSECLSPHKQAQQEVAAYCGRAEGAEEPTESSHSLLNFCGGIGDAGGKHERGVDGAQTIAHIDSCAGNHTASRNAIQPYIISSHPHHVTRGLADGLGTISMHERALVRLPMSDVRGESVMVEMFIDIGPDTCHFLLKPKSLNITACVEECHAVFEEPSGNLVQVKIHQPHGGPAGKNPYLVLAKLDHTPSQELPSAGCFATITTEEAQGWHAKMLDPCPTRLESTLREQGKKVEAIMALAVRNSCTLCDEKNATIPTLPRSTSRRPSEGPRASFGHTVFLDLAHITEEGYAKEKWVSLMVDVATGWWDVMALKTKDEVVQHMAAWIAKHGAMKELRCDRAPELRKGALGELCRKNFIHIVDSPPYTSATNGIVERPFRDVRGLLRTALERLGLKPLWWSLLLYGVAQVHNSTSDVSGSSPYMKRFGRPPLLTVTVGEQVVYKPRHGRKTLAFPGHTGMFLGCRNAQTALVRDHNGRLANIHPCDLSATHPGGLKWWTNNFTYIQARREKQARIHPPTPRLPTPTFPSTSSSHAQSLLLDLALLPEQPVADSSSDSESAASVRVTRARASARQLVPAEPDSTMGGARGGASGESEERGASGESNERSASGERNERGATGESDERGASCESDERGASGESAVSYESGDSAARTARESQDVASGSTPSNVHTLPPLTLPTATAVPERSEGISARTMVAGKHCVLAADRTGVLRVGRLLTKKSTTVDLSWLQQKPDLTWAPTELDYGIPLRDIQEAFLLVNDQIPPRIYDLIGTPACTPAAGEGYTMML
eukprot:GHVU01223522.1.p1 GENE.GHVU01223522.1~~GHVU01223522.1.p1  ORF type:complete len:1074 (+),score=114.98 GHVU01223522.1:2524-5745(+)